MTYQHLDREERFRISALLKEDLIQARIAVNRWRHKSTIGREIARYSGLRVYRPTRADTGADSERVVHQRQVCVADHASVERHATASHS